jgi:hypothetical protein
VLPLHSIVADACTCGRAACNSPGKHPRTKNGYKDATTELTKIKQWWSKFPDANIGIVTGKESGLVVMDIDPRNGGDVTFSNLCLAHGAPDTLSVKTGGDGTHLVFQYPDGVEWVKGQANALGDGVDIKADGGYIVAAPSLHASGQRYQWAEPQAAIAPLPDWLLASLVLPETKKEARHGAIVEGGRNNYMASVAGRLKQEGKANGELFRLLQEENHLSCTPPLSDDEIEQVARSIARYDDSPIKFRWLRHISDPDITIHATTHHVLVTLSIWMNTEGRSCYPTLEQIAKASRRTRKTVGDHLKIAVNGGLIKRFRISPKDKGGGKNWNYAYLAVLPDDV